MNYKNVFIIGSKSMGAYGGYETFVDKLTEYEQKRQENDTAFSKFRDQSDSSNDEEIYIKYHVACKANGNGAGIVTDGYHGAHCFAIHVPDKTGPAQALFYDIEALKYSIEYITHNKINNPIVYILACRIGPWISNFRNQIHDLGGQLYLNPDGHEWMRTKWPIPIRMYWKYSEKLMVKNADLVICDSKNIESYILDEYKRYEPSTTYIAYGSEISDQIVGDNETVLRYSEWAERYDIHPFNYYLVVGRFVPENNFEIMIREFMRSQSSKKLVIITTENKRFYKKLDSKLHFTNDARIIFAGPVYDQKLLEQIRFNAYGYLHGHSVGGTNPSLLEALGVTKLNLLLDVGFNHEVGEDAALYWNRSSGSLSELIDQADNMNQADIDALGVKAKERIANHYSWPFITEEYFKIFSKG